MSRLEQKYKPLELQRQTPGTSQMDEPTYVKVGVFRGFIQPVSGGESSAFDKVAERFSHRLYTNIATPAIYGDRVIQGGVTWRVVYATQVDGISSVGHHKEVLLQHV